MMACPKCGGDTAVTDCRLIGGVFRRRRKCKSCEQRFTTEENFVGQDLRVARTSSPGSTKAELKPELDRVIADLCQINRRFVP